MIFFGCLVAAGTDRKSTRAMQQNLTGTDAGGTRRLSTVRRWVQLGFLFVWLAPLGKWLHSIPACVFHCYACPLSSFACPVGLLANYAALAPAVVVIPWMIIGVVLIAGGLVGSMICGWVCPFGLVQDWLARLGPRNKLRVPGWLAYGRYVVLVGLVLALPMYWGARGLLYEEQPLTICKICPAGALEAGLPYSIQSLVTGGGWTMGGFKLGVLLVFLGAAVLIHRPWCRVLCPLGGALALMNRISLARLRVDSAKCTGCNLCHRRCPVQESPVRHPDSHRCIRCLECVRCGAMSVEVVPGRVRVVGGRDMPMPVGDSGPS